MNLFKQAALKVFKESGPLNLEKILQKLIQKDFYNQLEKHHG